MTTFVSGPVYSEDLDAVARISRAWATYTPVWSTTGTAPAIGNGTLSGASLKVGKTVWFWLEFAAGSTTTFGTGNFGFTLPTDKPLRSLAAVALLVDNSAAGGSIGVARADADGDIFRIHTSSTPVSGTVPFTWATDDKITISGHYEIA